MEVVSTSLGFSEVRRGIFVALQKNLNDELGVVEAFGQAEDSRLAIDLGIGFPEVDLERFLPENIYEGNHPSLTERPIDNYPNVAIMAHRSGQSASIGQFDQSFSSSDIAVYVESIVRIGPLETDGSQDPEAETILNLRCERTATAINNIVSSTSNLVLSQIPMSSQPRAALSNVFGARRDKKGQGPRYLIQLARLDYTQERVSRLPS